MSFLKKILDKYDDEQIVSAAQIIFAIFALILFYNYGYTTQDVEQIDKEIMESWKPSNTIKTQ